MSTNSGGLWTEGFGAIGATLKALSDQGVTIKHLAALRSDKELAKKVADLLINKFRLRDDATTKTWWQNFYLKYFGLKLNLIDVRIPKYRDGFDWVIIIASDLNISQIISTIDKYAKIKLFGIKVTKDDRSPKDGSYAIRCRKTEEADKELSHFSANMLEREKIPCVTLLERFIMGLAYFEETGQHLDNFGHTLCAGSKCSNDITSYITVPLVKYEGDSTFDLNKIIVSWAGPSDCNSRGREVIV